MRRIKIRLLLGLVALVTIVGCHKDPDPEPIPQPPVTVVIPKLSVASVTVEEGKTATANVTEGKTPFTVTVANPSLATATVNGGQITFSGLVAGQTTFTVKGSDGGTSAAIPLTVTAADPPDPNAEFKADGEIRWVVGSETLQNRMFYKDEGGQLLSSTKNKIGWATTDAVTYEFIEFVGSPAIGALNSPSVRSQSGVITPIKAEVVQIKDGKVWIVLKETASSPEKWICAYW